MKKTTFIFTILIIASIYSVKAQIGIGPKVVQYDNLIADLNVTGTKEIAIIVLDHRPQVLGEKRPDNNVGFFHAAVGIPYPLTTLNKNPLASDIANSIAASLSKKGFKCSVIASSPANSEKDVLENLKKSGADICVFLLLDKWWTDSWTATVLDYDVTLSVYDKNAELLSSKKFIESAKIIGAIIWGKEFKKDIPKAFVVELGKFFNDAEIIKSFE